MKKNNIAQEIPELRSRLYVFFCVLSAVLGLTFGVVGYDSAHAVMEYSGIALFLGADGLLIRFLFRHPW